MVIVRVLLSVSAIAAALYFGTEAIVVVLVGVLAALVLMKGRAVRRKVDE